MMNLPAIKEGFLQRIPGEAGYRFRRFFIGLWLIYDGIDLFSGQTRSYIQGYFSLGGKIPIDFYLPALILVQLMILIGFFPRLFLAAAVVLRLLEAGEFALNDFFYYAVTAAILFWFDFEGSSKTDRTQSAWPRQVLMLQTAWIYLASAILKMNPSFLSGGVLFVRHQYQLAASGLFYPQFYRTWLSSLEFNRMLAILTVGAELLLPACFILVWARPDLKQKVKPYGLGLGLLIHGYAAYALNVWFFGLSLVAQLVFLFS